MSKNSLPKKISALLSLAEDVADGATTMGATLNLKQNTAAEVRADLEAAREAHAAFNTARAAKAPLSAAIAAADRDARVFLTIARDSLKPALGADWSAAWADAGFVNATIALPVAAAERMELLMQFRNYLTAQPAREWAAHNVTAARAAALHTQLSDARAALHVHLGNLAAKKIDRDGAVEALRRRLRGLIAELAQLLPPDSTDWHAFGLQPPASPQTPEAPDRPVLTANPADPGALYLDWDDVPRAEHYRVLRLLPSDPEPASVESVTESEVRLHGQPRGVLLKFTVSAVNDAGESPPSATSEITLP